ncbi:MAG: four helix bundle protein [Pyrinomonadaceae bacterium]
MAKSIALEKAIQFALRIVKLYKYLTEEKKEFVLSKQMLVSGTFIAKHVKAATVAESRGNFGSEMFKGMQMASDTELWLFLLHEGGWIEDKYFESINTDCVEMIKLTASISKTSREND